MTGGTVAALEQAGHDRSEVRRSSVNSLISSASKTSQTSRMSLSSTASKLVQRFRSSSRTKSVDDEDLHVAVGDICKTRSLVTVRSEEALESHMIAELSIGTQLEILELGQLPRRAKVEIHHGLLGNHSPSGTSGWISIKTRDNYALISKVAVESPPSFETGGRHQVLSQVTLRTAEDPDSAEVCDLQPGTIVTIAAIGTDPRCAKVWTAAGEGWLPLSTAQGQFLVGKIQGQAAKVRSSTSPRLFAGSQQERMKKFLESARVGDLDALRKASNGGLSSTVFGVGKFDANCSDVRGMTALIYASAFGQRNIV